MTADSLKEELQKAVDSEDAKEFMPARNAALSKALAETMDVEVPDTLVTKQAKEKFAMMMTDMRNNGVSDEEIKKQISPENFLKYKKIVKESIVKDFKVSMAVDEIGRMEGIEVPDYQVEEQMQGIREEAQKSGEEFDEAQIKPRVEATLQREAVMDFLAEKANLSVEFEEDEFDEELLSKLAEESLAREEAVQVEPSTPAVQDVEVVEAVIEEEPEPEVVEAVAEAPAAEEPTEEAPVEAEERDYSSMSVEEKAYYSLLDAGAINPKK